MKETPILFSAPMVRAILEGRKSTTRRVINPQPAYRDSKLSSCDWTWITKTKLVGWPEEEFCVEMIKHCPYGQAGDRLWVRETFALEPKSAVGDKVLYRADAEQKSWAWKPSIFMPRWASRITLEVIGVKVERVKDISIEDSKAEGVMPDYAHQCADLGHPHDSRSLFHRLWDSINAKRGYGWDKNPWVWVISFKRVK
jgi:hypothetical protein